MDRAIAMMMATAAAAMSKGVTDGPINKKMEFVRGAGSSKHKNGFMPKGTQPKLLPQNQIGARKYFRKFSF